MKKFLSKFLVLTMVVSLCVGFVQVSAADYTLTLGAPATAETGTQFDLTFTASGLSVDNVASTWVLQVSYDKTKVTPVRFTSGANNGKAMFTSTLYAATAVTVTEPTANGNTAYIGIVLDGDELSATTLLGTIKFNAIAAGNPAITVVNSASSAADFVPNDHTITGANPTMTITAPDQPQTAPLSTLFTATAPTSALNDGSIAGTTTAMEYKISGGASYTVVTGTSITGLTAGDYLIRYAAKTGYTASPDTTITVPVYVAPTPKELAIADAISTIGALPSPITLADKSAVEAARGKVTTATGLEAVDTDITNLATLVAAELRIASLEADALAKANAISAANTAIANLPATITLSDKAAVVAARGLVADAQVLLAVDSDFTNLTKLTDAETTIATLEAAAAAKALAITTAYNAIAALPATITLSNEAAVVVARGLVATAIAAGAVDTDITNLATLVAAEGTIATLNAELTTKLNAITAAYNAIAALPATIALTDEAAVVAARGLVGTAIAAGAVDADITNLTKLTDAEATIVTLKAAAAEKANAITAANTAISELPATITLSDETAVVSARTLVTAAQAKGAVNSDFVNLSKLTDAEATIAAIKATQISATAGSVTTNVYPGSTNVKIAITMTNLTNAKNFDFGLSYDNTKLTYASIEKGDDCTATATVDSTSNTSKLGVAGLTTDTGISGTQVVAYIVFNVKAAAAVGDTTLTLSGVYVGLPETAVTTVTNGKITITANLDPNLPAAQAAVSAYETGALTTLTEVATAEGKKAAAVSAVATLTIADKTPFNTRITARDTAIAAARTALETAAAEAAATEAVVTYETGALTTLTEVATAEGKKAAADTAVAGLAAGDVKTALLARITARATAIADAKTALETAAAIAAAITKVNTGSFAAADLTTASITDVNTAKINAYIVAVKAERRAKGSDLTSVEIQKAVTDANAVLATQIGDIDAVNGIHSSDASMLKQFYLGNIEFSAEKAVKADFNNDGTINSADLVSILNKAAEANAQ